MLPAIFGLSGLTLSDDERAFFRDADPAGYILFGRNVESRAQVRALTDNLRELHGRARTFICIDQEGGRVARMKPPVWAAYPAGEAFDRLYETAPISAIEAVRAHAEALGSIWPKSGSASIACRCSMCGKQVRTMWSAIAPWGTSRCAWRPWAARCWKVLRGPGWQA